MKKHTKATAGLLAVIGAFLFLLIAFSSSFEGLYGAWQTEEYSHGVLIPFLAILMGWHRLADRRPRIETNWAGPAILFIGFFFLAFSRLSAFEPFSHYGFLVSLVGLSLSFFGKNVTSVLMVSFIYLFFAIPLPRLIYVALSADMQLLSSTLGVWALQGIGISVYQEGNVIDLGGYQLQVVEACSGLRYLFPLMSFSFLVAFLYKGALWQRLIIFLSAIPLTIAMNSFRIAVVGVTVNFWGIGMAEGFLHDFEGWAVFSVCVLLLISETKLFSLLPSSIEKDKNGRKTEWIDLTYFSLPKIPSAFPSIPFSWPALVAFSLCVAGAALFSSGLIDKRPEIAPARTTFATFPSKIADWNGTTKALSLAELSKLDVTDYYLGDYRKEGSVKSVNLYMAYYASQRVGSSIHSPSNCLPGSGWKVEERDIVPVALRVQTIPVTRMVLRKDNEGLLVYYWFHGRGRILNEQYGAKWYLAVDSIRINRTDGALVRVSTPFAPNEKLEDADRLMQDFLAAAVPLFENYIPGAIP